MALRGELIGKSLEVEELARGFYERLMQRVPVASELWERLIQGEEKHARIISEASDLVASGHTPEEIIFPCIRMLQYTCDMIKAMSMELDSRGVEERQAYAYAMEVEKTTGERYMQSAIKFARSHVLHEMFQRIGVEEQNHQQMIAEFMQKRGVTI